MRILPVPLWFPLVVPTGWPLLLGMAIVVLLVTSCLGLSHGRLVRPLPRDKVVALESAALADARERDRFATMVGWAAAHDAFRLRAVHRLVADHEGEAQVLRVALVRLRLVASLGIDEIDRLRQVQAARAPSGPSVSPRVTRALLVGVVLPGDVALTTTALIVHDGEIPIALGVVLALGLAGGLFLSGKLLGVELCRSPLHRRRLAVGFAGIAVITAALVALRTHERGLWLLVSLAPTISAIASTILASSRDTVLDDTRSQAAIARAGLDRALDDVDHAAVRLARTRGRLMAAVTALVVARDHVARAGARATDLRVVAPHTNAARVLADLGVTLGPDALAEAMEALDAIRPRLAQTSASTTLRSAA